MKYLSKILVLVPALLVFITGCDKVDSLPLFEKGAGTVTLSASASNIAPAASDSNNVAVTFSWTDPKYAADPATFKYVLEIDSTGKNFANASQKITIGKLSQGVLAKELNNMLLAKGYAFNGTYDLDVRLLSSYGNNNEQYKSNTVKIKYKIYVTPPKVTLPVTGKLFLVGDATQGNWNNPVPVPTQEFAKIDSVTWAGVFQLNGNAEYLVLPENGSWSTKYSVADKSLAGLRTGGDFGFNLNDNFPGPTTGGWYVITLNFQTGKFTVNPFTGTMPTNLFIVGDATAGQWNNPVPVPSQQLTRVNSSVWQLTNFPMTGNKEYLLLPVNGSWSNKYAVADKTAAGARVEGPFGYNLNDNFPGPVNSGNYTLTVNFATGKYKVQ